MFYYDRQAGKSVPGTLEALGYEVRKVTADVAYYDIRETFYGAAATELMIPTTMDVVSLKLDRSAKDIAKLIKQNTGEDIGIYPDDGDKVAVAYLLPIDSNHSAFVCTSEPE